jgi:hypothetical protein
MPKLLIRWAIETVLGILLNGFQEVFLEKNHEVWIDRISHAIHVAVGNNVVFIYLD